MTVYALGAVTAGVAAGELLMQGVKVSRLVLGLLGVTLAVVGVRLVTW